MRVCDYVCLSVAPVVAIRQNAFHDSCTNVLSPQLLASQLLLHQVVTLEIFTQTQTSQTRMISLSTSLRQDSGQSGSLTDGMYAVLGGCSSFVLSLVISLNTLKYINNCNNYYNILYYLCH